MSKRIGIVDQVRIALSKQFRLATTIGCLLGAIVPLATFAIIHIELSATEDWYTQPELLIVVGGLIYSARTVYQWGKLAFSSWAKAAGFTLLLEGVMTLSSQGWLATLALIYLCLINAIATGVTLARGIAADAQAEPVAAIARIRPSRAQSRPKLRV